MLTFLKKKIGHVGFLETSAELLIKGQVRGSRKRKGKENYHTLNKPIFIAQMGTP